MDDIYLYTGKTLSLLQKWEEEFKVLTQHYKIEKSDDKRSLSNMNLFLLRNNIINNEEYLLIKEIIEKRNMVIHRMFIDYKENILTMKTLLVQINDAINMSLILFNKLLNNAKEHK